jgi:fused signal recognition particle receptor
MGFFDFFSGKKKEELQESLDKGLEKTKEGFFGRLARIVAGKSEIDDEVLDDLEEVLIGSDVGTPTTLKIIGRIQDRVKRDKYSSTSELDKMLREEIAVLLEEGAPDPGMIFRNLPSKPYIVMVVGVNGVGKTTTIGKLASQFHAAGKKVVLGAADTFRAAAVDQLKTWGQRSNVPVIEHRMNSDPASVAYDAVKQGVELDADVVIIDTAGRLHNKVNLMNELGKIKRVMQKVIPDAPQEVLLVLDGSTGQNAMRQAEEFSKVTDVTALAITKLDGTAKGGVVIGIADQLKVPVKYIGVGEKIEDLQIFDRHAFVESLFGRKIS